MLKVVIRRPGGYEQLQFEKCPSPKPEAGQVLVQVEASGVNYADVLVRWGVYSSAKEFVGWPITPGFEFSGRVDSVGEGVTQFKPGDLVFGFTRFGGYSSHLVVPESQLVSLPSQLGPDEAAGFPAVFLTAYHALCQHVIVRPGMKIMVHSAAGGCGTAMLQIGKILGCEMTGVVGAPHKVKVARQYGADHVIDKSSEDLWGRAKQISPEGYDIVLDANGYTTLKQSFRALRPTGKLIAYGSHSLLPRKGGRINYAKLAINYLKTPKMNPLKMMTYNKSIVTFNVSYLMERKELVQEGIAQLVRWTKEGRLKAPPVKVYPFKEVARAHADIESGMTVGKLVLSHRA
jgi:synaptic vesicle membrane protein VAT-1